MDYEEKWLEEINRMDQHIADIKAALLAKGVRLKVAACGCCDSPWVHIEIDGVEIAKIEGQNIDMFEEDA